MRKASKNSKEVGRIVKKECWPIEVCCDLSLFSYELMKFTFDYGGLLWKLIGIMGVIEGRNFSLQR